MELSKEAAEQLRTEIEAAIANQAAQAQPAGIPIATICQNKALIMGFLSMLVGLLPGVLGKTVGQIVIGAAETWFSSKCPK